MGHDPYLPLQRDPIPADLDRARQSVPPLAQAVDAARRIAGADAMVVAWVSDIHLHARRRYAEPLSIYASDVDASASFATAAASTRWIARTR